MRCRCRWCRWLGGGGEYRVHGAVATPERGGVPGQEVRIIDRNVGRDVLLAQATSGEDGRYAARFSAAAVHRRGKRHPDLEVRVLAGERVLARSEVRYEAGAEETIDVLLPRDAAGTPSEYELVLRAVRRHFDGELTALREDDEQHDITFLANKTGWDARAVALISIAHSLRRQAAAAGADGLRPEHFYALLRSGLAADPEAVFGLEPKRAGEVWAEAAAGDVVPAAVGEDVAAAVADFERAAAAIALGASWTPGAASLEELLAVSLGDDLAGRRRFAQLLVAHRGDPRGLWKAVDREFDRETTRRLRLDGQLASLTLDNAAVLERLHRAHVEEPLSSAVDLAHRGLHRSERWHRLIEDAVPPQIPGEDAAAKRANYAELLAAQVRLSFPTAVVADLVAHGDLELGEDQEVRKEAHRFLRENEAGFAIGAQPLDRYLAAADLRLEQPVREQLLRLQRVYRLTPDDRAMGALLANDLDSAARIVQHTRAEFVAAVGEEMGGAEVAELTWAKAQQVHVAVLNLASSYMTTRVAPALGAAPAARVIDPGAQLGAVPPGGDAAAAVPTLERLFGSLDYCDCEHCRSVLSPAAYLVDLLLFADRPHNEKENPLTVLLERRPDLQHLPLTCENTNTPLPYVDIVNETLEHLVVNDLSLAGYAGHDTDGEASEEELLANPQFVQEQAYTALREQETFPPPLPFHRPLELLRRHLAALDTSLAAAMEALRSDESVDRAAADGYGWADILAERVGFSPIEHDLLTKPVGLAELYGFPAGTGEAGAIAQLANAKGFSRRVGIEYEELKRLVETSFVNPEAWLIPKLERLGLSLTTLEEVRKGTLPDSKLEPLLPAKVTAAEVHDFVGRYFERAKRLIVIGEGEGGARPCSLDGYRLRYADPDPGAAALSAEDFARLARFVRLWRKLGWTIEQTDRVLAALGPAADGAGFAKLVM
ncbi:MAG TPA: Tc toxin subunit A, partial [Solirubrobacterales bacterium]|nr:Tc toxin subunit A [Solirubrobacterales bacterium]